MGWFEEQIKNREENDREIVSDAFAGIAGAVLGKRLSAALDDDRIKTKDELDRILKFYHIKPSEIPENITDVNDQLDYLLHPNGIMRRTIKLGEHWYRDAVGALLGVRKDNGQVTALLPSGLSGYCFYDTDGKKRKLSRRTEKLFEEEAICFYKPFPLKELGIPDFAKYIVGTLSVSDLVLFALVTLAVTLVGLFSPKLNQLIFSDVIESGSLRLVFAMSVFLFCLSISMVIINAVKSLIMARINTKLSLSVQSATMMRVLSLPPSFFKEYASGDLTSRATYIQSLCNMLVSTVLSTGLTSVFSLIYISQISAYAPTLVVPAICIILVTILFSTVSTLLQMKISKKQMEYSSKLNGLEYSLISGVQKLKLSGAENRAFAKWGKSYAKEAALTYNPPAFIKINSVISMAISLVGSIVMFYMAVKNHIGVADYYAFNTAYGMVSGAFASLAEIAFSIARIKPTVDMARPIMEALPEASESKKAITRLSGNIELNNITFRYNEDMPNVIDGLSLKIRSGQYVAIVGSTGCGKSTLMRLLLGFEKPQKGAIYFDGKDLSKINLRSQRHCIGVVLQNGKLFQGDIFSNIIISAPKLTLDEAWEAAELAGIADDIRKMPMGMNTIISEGSGGISGGQRQRLMIARAIAPKPKVLLLDEATSALDNITQKKLADALAGLKCTRIVIAHRLSTIKQCDRILVLDKGKIAEEGTYNELIEKNGIFAKLIERQRLEEAN